MYRFKIDGIVYPGVCDNIRLSDEPTEGFPIGPSEVSGAITFSFAAYEYLIKKNIDHIFQFEIEELVGLGAWQQEWTGTFTKADCRINEDSKWFKVKPLTDDPIKNILNSLGNEVDFLTLGVSDVSIGVNTGSVWQMYRLGGPSIMNINKFGAYSTPVSNPIDSAAVLATDYFFDDFPHEVFYIAGPHPERGNYYLSSPNTYANGPSIIDVDLFNDSIKVTTAGQSWTGSGSNSQGSYPITLSPDNGQAYSLQVDRMLIFARLVTNAENISFNVTSVGDPNRNQDPIVPTIDIPENDFTGITTFKKCLPGSLFYWGDLGRPEIVGSDGNQDSGTLGQFYDEAIYYPGFYFKELAGHEPIYGQVWFSNSWWADVSIEFFQKIGSIKNLIRVRGYYSEDVIDKLLKEIDADSSYRDSYSSFLSSPVDPIAGVAFKLAIIPKSNVINPFADTFATKAFLSLKEILDAKVFSFNGEWWINNDRQLAFEHLEFRENGGTYEGQIIGTDLNEYVHFKSGRKLTWHTNEYDYLKEEMPEEIKRTWMDDQSPNFEGDSIKITSNFKEVGSIKDMRISKFSADLENALAVPSNYVEKGFFIVALDSQNNVLSSSVPGLSQNMYNGLFSTPFLNYSYWRHRLPAQKAIINGIEEDAITVRRLKQQSIVIDSSVPITDIALIKTGLNRFIQKGARLVSKSRSLDKGDLEIKLLHETE